MESVNPSTGERLATYAVHSPAEIEGCISRATRAFRSHRSTSFDERSGKVNHLAELLASGAEEFARLMTREMGKPISQAIAEAKKCAWVCRYYAENAEKMLADAPVDTDAHRSYVSFQPLGPILAVMPWNFPFWQVLRFAAPAVMAGNVALLKHASNVTGCALAIESLFREAGFEEGIFQSLIVPHDALESVISDRRIRATTLTGSEFAGRSVGAASGRNLIPAVLELGGSDPFIVLADAPLKETVHMAVQARMQNNGQSCIAAKRFIVEEPLAEAFTEQLVSAVESMSVGDPMHPATELGPLAREDLRETVRDQVERAVSGGARIATGGHVLQGPGFYFQPTVLTDVLPGSVAFEEEIFGPVAPITVARDAEHALSLANDSPYGLGAAVFTADIERGEKIALAIEAGCTFVNAMVKSDPRLPFGGIKDSGYGRELSEFGIREFVNVKTVWIDESA